MVATLLRSELWHDCLLVPFVDTEHNNTELSNWVIGGGTFLLTLGSGMSRSGLYYQCSRCGWAGRCGWSW